jgi:hypothetical protein
MAKKGSQARHEHEEVSKLPEGTQAVISNPK